MSPRAPLTFAFALAAPLLVACRARPTADECARMLDRYVDMTLGQDPTLAGLPGDRAAEAREARRASKRGEPAYARAKAQCSEEVTRAQLACAMAAPTPNDWEACVD